MAADKRKRRFSTYILPILFCGLLIALAVLTDRHTEQPVKVVLQEGEPLTLTEQAIETQHFCNTLHWPTCQETPSAAAGSCCVACTRLSFPIWQIGGLD